MGTLREYTHWFSDEYDEYNNRKLKEDTPENIKKQYYEKIKRKNESNQMFFED